MPVLDKATNLYEQTARIAAVIKGKRNLTAQDTATIALFTVLNDLADSGMDASAVLEVHTEGESAEDAKRADKASEWRRATRDRLKCLMTAAKNYQLTYCMPSGLLPKPEAGADVEDFA